MLTCAGLASSQTINRISIHSDIAATVDCISMPNDPGAEPRSGLARRWMLYNVKLEDATESFQELEHFGPREIQSEVDGLVLWGTWQQYDCDSCFIEIGYYTVPWASWTPEKVVTKRWKRRMSSN